MAVKFYLFFKCFFDFKEIWFTWETWYPELIGDDEIFKMAANFLTIFFISPISMKFYIFV